MTKRALTLQEAHVRGAELAQLHATRFADYVAGLDASRLSARVPGGEWTVAETVTHVQSVLLRYTVDRRRAETPGAVATQNAEDIVRLGVDVGGAVASMKEQIELLALAPKAFEPEHRFPFHAGQELTLAGAWGNLLGELLAHGDDIARATGSPFAIPSEDLEILWRFTTTVTGGWLRAEAAAFSDAWRLRFGFGAIDAVFEAGAVEWGENLAAEPGHVIDVEDAAEFTLTFPYRRRPVTDPAVALLAARFRDL